MYLLLAVHKPSPVFTYSDIVNCPLIMHGFLACPTPHRAALGVRLLVAED